MPKIINTKRAHKQYFYYVPYSDDEDDASINNSQSCEKCNTNVQCDENCDNELLQDQDRPSCSKTVPCTHIHPKLGNELNSDSDPSMLKHTKGSDNSSNSAEVNVNGEKPESENSPDTNPKRARRNSKRKRDSEDSCPVCGLTIRHTDLQSHYEKEVDSLKQIARNVRRYRIPPYVQRDGFRCGFNMAFFKTKGNRESRIAAHKAKYVKRNSVLCPVCRIRLVGTEEEINAHVFECFGEDDYDVNVTDTDDNVEEYEIGDETRIRAISLVPGGHRALHGSSSQSRPTDEDTDLNVDVEDTQAFGKPQYTELDVIHNIGSSSLGSQTENQREEQLRRAVASDSSAEPQTIRGNKWSQNCEIENEIEKIKSSCSKDKSTEEKEEDTKAQSDKEEKDAQNAESDVVSTLNERINDMDQEKSVKCLICLEPYTRPVVSTTCWHVHCEECWLVSMGVKKLCPQCNMIVCPTDLRRIYL